MATTPKKRSKKSKVTRTSSRVESLSQLKKTIATQEKTIASQEKTIATQARELRQAAEQQTTTGEVLRIIASSPTELQSVLDTLLANAVKLSGATKGHIRQYDGEFLRYVSHYNESVEVIAALNQLPQRPRPESMSTRALLEKNAIHVLDAQVEPSYRAPAAQANARTMLIVPLLREDSGIGTITIWRDIVKPFTERQIDLVKTFADQAVIAIENVRLFKELQDRNRQLTEALEQQTATSEILGVIAGSPTDIQPVLDVVVENAARLCEASDAQILRVEGDILRLAASHGPLPTSQTRPINRQLASGRAVIDRQTIHVQDITLAEDEFPYTRTLGIPRGIRTFLATPLLCKGDPIGAIVIRRTEVRPFSEKQIALLKTFADQAVIAIENVRLFKELQERNTELREALEHQTATAEVLGIISRSPTDVQPVLDAIIESAALVCAIDDVLLRLREGDTLVSRAHFGPVAIGRVQMGIDEPEFCWMREHGALHIPDVRAQNDFPMMGSLGNYRTYLAAPLRHQGEFIGLLGARRIEVRPFTSAQIKLLETFADQAVIAIENVRLFNELKESLEQQTATSEILGVIASSPTDIQPVLDVVAANAARLCEADDAQILRVDGDVLRRAASYGSHQTPEARPLTRDVAASRAVIDRQTVHVHDIRAAEDQGFIKATLPLALARAVRY
jgi:GAF domain-containing protein